MGPCVCVQQVLGLYCAYECRRADGCFVCELICMCAMCIGTYVCMCVCLFMYRYVYMSTLVYVCIGMHVKTFDRELEYKRPSGVSEVV